VHVPYKGMAPAVSDLVGGQVQMMFAGISTALPHIRAGKLVPLAIASPKRSPQLPDVPTVAESGFPGFDVTSWYGIVVRSGTPAAIVKKLHADMAEALAAPDVKDKLAGLGLDPSGNTPEEFARMIASESRKWSEIVKKAGIKPQQ
jgi:tripartite-type tricarboxylate transporter receptor subunit TctC